MCRRIETRFIQDYMKRSHATFLNPAFIDWIVRDELDNNSALPPTTLKQRCALHKHAYTYAAKFVAEKCDEINRSVHD